MVRYLFVSQVSGDYLIIFKAKFINFHYKLILLPIREAFRIFQTKLLQKMNTAIFTFSILGRIKYLCNIQ